MSASDDACPGPWRLSPNTFWRSEGDEIIVATERTILRLDSHSAAILCSILGSSLNNKIVLSEPNFAAEEVEDLYQLLKSENMILRATKALATNSREVTHFGAGPYGAAPSKYSRKDM
ncbi:hypothetical protein [Mesorhizobium amorphae]|uniref:hypothetical protein n=1 Tax=Mesorhizobium amorphae TaxID=71433 RepID=UPI0017860A8B|nr:hypothetical protein [Mesorhizobium amorphae]